MRVIGLGWQWTFTTDPLVVQNSLSFTYLSRKEHQGGWNTASFFSMDKAKNIKIKIKGCRSKAIWFIDPAAVEPQWTAKLETSWTTSCTEQGSRFHALCNHRQTISSPGSRYEVGYYLDWYTLEGIRTPNKSCQLVFFGTATFIFLDEIHLERMKHSDCLLLLYL